LIHSDVSSLFLISAAIAAACAVATVYPYLIYPLLLRLLPVRLVAHADVPLRFSLLLCAYNEAESLPAKLQNVRALRARHPDLQVLAFDDGSNDGTWQLLSSDPALITAVRGKGRCGKAFGMKTLAKLAEGDVLVFTDANVIVDATALDRLRTYFGDPEVGGVCGSLVYEHDPDSATSTVGALYWRLEESIKELESRSGSVMGADGSIFSIRRTLYPDFPDTVLDDLTVSMSAVFAGKRLVRAADVVAYERSVAQRSEEFARKVRIAARAFHTNAVLLPQLRRMSPINRFKYASRKLIRWFGAVPLAVGSIAALVAAASVSLAAFAILAGLVAATGALAIVARRGPLAAGAEIVIAMGATAIGVFKAAQGHRMVTWAPPKSR
jgi:cellulose synthase/poly-beta-1,6-N-acetylglucosamine synthase-like glycosyltransferase